MIHFSGHFKGASTFLTPKLSLEMANKVIVPQKINYVPHFLKQRDINSYYVLLLYIIYVMESGRFSQSPAFFKRAGHNVEGFLLYVPLRRFYSVLYIPLFCRSREKCGRLSTIIPQSPHGSSAVYINTWKIVKNYKIDGPWLKNDLKLPMFLCLRKFRT